MSKKQARIEVQAWETKGALLETYSYTAGAVEPFPSHIHPEYQFALCLDGGGEYFYRGSHLRFPAFSLCVLHSGEPHAPSSARWVARPSSYLMMYLDPEAMLDVVNEIGPRRVSSIPYFSQVIIDDQSLVANYRQLFSRQESTSSALERESLQLSFFARLIVQHAQNRPAVPAFRAHQTAVRRAIEFLEHHFARNISLDELAQVAGVSKFYLCRAFRQQLNISPHHYQTQLRIAHARRLLLRGSSAAEVASAVGFYDQSHLGKYFKRITGASPKAYRARAISS